MRKLMIAAALALGTAATPTLAQVTVPTGLVNVTVTDVSVLNNLLTNAQIAALNELNVPIIVQVPISVAANVCDLTIAALAEQRKTGGAACDAKSGNAALARAVSRQFLRQDR